MIASENALETIEILKKITVRNRFGELEETGEFETISKPNAKEMFMFGKEKDITSQITALKKCKFKIRYDRSIDETMYVRYYDELYNIRSIDHVGRADTILVAERAKE
jgi:SPP1 family predicted phage head-tail adaptor